ncbi:MAG: RelA/SpoT family protein [Cytophagaceae bacterium]|jgi:GTP pyrophosphokinase|nr:RelA/SpoT family protein [Cytophagaceae bacterium]
MTDNKQLVTLDNSLLITRSYRKLLKASSVLNLQPNDVKKMRQTITALLADTASEQLLSGLPTVVHSLEVARIVVGEIGLGRTSLICSLLCEAMRTSAVSIEKVEKHFGKQVADLTGGLAKVFELYRQKTSIQTENFQKLFLTSAQDARVILIMIADKLQAMRTLDRYDDESRMNTAMEASYLYAPMAHRLGLYTIKSEMEDLVMKHTDREMYRFIAKKLNETKRARDRYIDEFIAPLKAELEKQGLKFDIKGRTKSIHSIHNKMKKQGVEFKQVYDLFAIRIIIDTELQNEKADCWRAYSVVANNYQPNPRRMRDWLSAPKSNGYESLHTTVLGPQNKWVEVQIRTKRMDEIAELGLAAHWKYKGVRSDTMLEEWLALFREIINSPERSAFDENPKQSIAVKNAPIPTTANVLSGFKINLYNSEIFIFTPQGDLKRLVKGATVLDFAFHIHTDVGKRCTGARVNKKNVSLRHELHNGDLVEIITSSNQTPKHSWLKVVVTSRAKAKLKQALRDMEYKQAELGREMLLRRLKNRKQELTDQLINQLVKYFKHKSTHNFFCDIANAKLDVVTVLEYIQGSGKKEADVQETPNSRSAERFVTATPNEVRYGDEVLIIDKNLTRVDYKLAKCCNPIFGDEVFGFVTVSGGIKIHRINCPNANDMLNKFGYRIVKTQWTGEAGNSYIAAIKIMGNDDIGIVSNISQIISKEMNLKMRAISVDSQEGLFEGTVTVFVNSNQTLGTLIRKLSSVKGVLSVVRIDTVT